MKTNKLIFIIMLLHFIDYNILFGQGKNLPESLVDVGEFGGWVAEGIITHSFVNYQTYLYATNNEDLWVYNIGNNPETPEHVSTIPLSPYYGNKIFIHAGNLYITAGNNDPPNYFLIYSLNDPENPQLESFLDTGFPILDMVFNDSYAFIIHSNSSDIAIYNISDISLPQFYSNYTLGGEVKTLEINTSRNILFAGYYGNVSNQKIGMFDISNIDNIISLDAISTFGDIPQRINVFDDNTLWFIKNFTGNDGSFLYACDYSDGQNINVIDSYFISINSNSWDMKIINDYVAVTFPGFGLATYELSDENEIVAGPSIELTEPRDFIAFNTGKKNNGNYYSYVINGYGHAHFIDGSEPNKIIKFIPPGGTNKAYLSLSINPAQAGTEGCTTDPAPGLHEYEINETVSITAIPNEDNAWFFKEWSGAISSPNPSANIIMDADKNVTANFIELSFTVSGSKDLEIHCPTDIGDVGNRKNFLMIPVTGCASEVDDWNWYGFTIDASGTGNEKMDISEVSVYKGETKIYSGTFSSDDGRLVISFSQAVPVGAGKCETVQLFYKFDFVPDYYPDNEPVNYFIATRATVAQPVNYEEGKVLGSAHNTNFIFTRVYNSRNESYMKIQDAVNESQENDICYVCPGTYKEKIEINDKDRIKIISTEGAEKTIIAPVSAQFPIQIITSKFIELNGLKITDYIGSIVNKEMTSAVFTFGADDLKIKNCLFESNRKRNKFGISIDALSDRALIQDNKINNFGVAISLDNNMNTKIINNTLMYNFNGIDIKGLEKKANLQNTIEGNTISYSDHIAIEILSSYNDNIINNKIYKNGSSSLSDAIQLNGTYNTLIRGNKIYENAGDGIFAHASKKLYIEENKISNHDQGEQGSGTSAGVELWDVKLAYVTDNSFIHNCTGIEQRDCDQVYSRGNYFNDSFCLSTGINLSNSSGAIIGNNIANNNGTGLLCADNTDVIVSLNNILGNEEFGVKNEDPEIIITADNNFWGSEDGPDAEDINGNINVNNWLTEEVSVIAFAKQDTIYALDSTADSTYLFVQNLSNPIDRVKLNLSDDLGWVEPIINEEKDLEDSTGISWTIHYNVPKKNKTISTVNYTVETVNKNKVFSGIFYIATYTPQVKEIKLFPDSITTMVGDSVQFTFTGFDQHSNFVEFEPTWESTNGNINGEGLFISDNYIGEVFVTVSDVLTGAQETVVLYNTDEEPELTQISITPASITLEANTMFQFTAKGYNQFSFPQYTGFVWATTGGEILDEGVFIAPETTGNYTVTVSNINGSVSAAASVDITEATEVESENIPEQYVLKQNYPNPFNPTTTIEYSLPVRSNVKIEVFNILGQKIDNLVNSIESAGYKSFIWDAGRFASGIYFLRIIAEPLSKSEVKNFNGFIAIKKLVLLK